MMRRAVNPRGADEILASQEETRALRAADALASAVGDERGAVFQVDVRHRQDLRRRVDEHRHALPIGQLGDRPRAERPLVGFGTREDVDHRRARTECRVELLAGADFDDAHADGTDRSVVHVARVLRDDHFVFRKPGQIGNAHVPIGIPAGDARRRRVRQRRRAARRHHAPFRFRQLGEAGADPRHQLVEVDVVLRRGVDRRAHFRQHERAADDGEGAARVDERPHADGLIDVFADAKSVGGGRCSGRPSGGRRCRSGAAAKDRRQREQRRSPKQLAARPVTCQCVEHRISRPCRGTR